MEGKEDNRNESKTRRSERLVKQELPFSQPKTLSRVSNPTKEIKKIEISESQNIEMENEEDEISQGSNKGKIYPGYPKS